MLKYEDANELLTSEFEAMRTAFRYDDDRDLYEGEDGCYGLYCDAFVPYIIKQLDDGNDAELKRIFAFTEKLFTDGDDELVNLAAVSIVEDIYYEHDYDNKYKDKIYSLCGNLTRKSFDDMEGD